MYRFTRKKALGFTLAELLSALAILGVIATFTIPKVLQGQQDQRRIAIFKETIASVHQALYNDWVLTGGEMTSHDRAILFANLNYIKQCPTDAAAEGCHPSMVGGVNDPALVMHNGAVVGDLDGYNMSFGPGARVAAIIIDWNGPELPNAVYDDQILLYINVGSASTTLIAPGIPAGGLNTHTGNSLYVAQWNEIFQ